MPNQNVAKNNRFMFNLTGYRDLSYRVQTASIGSINLGSTPYATRNVDLLLPSNKIDYSPMSIRVLVSENFQEWFDAIRWNYDLPYLNAAHLEGNQTGILTLMNANNVPVMEITYHACVPISITEIDFDIAADGEETLTFDLTLSYDTFSVKNLITGEVLEYGER